MTRSGDRTVRDRAAQPPIGQGEWPLGGEEMTNQR